MAKEGISRSFRLHPSDDKERQAIEIIEAWEEKGYSIRDIITSAILRSAGFEPDMFKTGNERLTPALLEAILTDFGKELIQTIRENGGVPSTPQNKPKPAPFDDEDEDLEAMRNLVKGHSARSAKK